MLVMVLEVVVWKTVCWTPSGRAAPVLRGTPSAPVVQILLLLLAVAATVCVEFEASGKPIGASNSAAEACPFLSEIDHV